MIYHLPKVLTQHHLNQVKSLLNHATFEDGRLTAGEIAKHVKHNLELKHQNNIGQQLNELIMPHLVRHGIYSKAAFALRIAAPIYAKYTQGMSYGNHVDNPIMGQGNLYRCDLAITLFLSEPSNYAGGELIIQSPFGEHSLKMPAGDAVLYPASSVHHVNEITRGERLVAVTWAQSMIRSSEQRSLLINLCEVRDSLLVEQTNAKLAKKIDEVYVNLVRMWAQL